MPSSAPAPPSPCRSGPTASSSWTPARASARPTSWPRSGSSRTRPIRYIINTSADRDHVGGNDDVSKAGQSVIPTGGLNEIGAAGGRAPILAEEHVQSAMTAPHGRAVAVSVRRVADRDLLVGPDGNAEGPLLQRRSDHHHLSAERAHRRRQRGVLPPLRRAWSPAMSSTRRAFRVIDLEKGGSIQGVIDALNRIIAITVPPIPLIWQEGGTVVVAGARAHQPRGRRRGLPRHGHDRPRPRPGPDQEGHDARRRYARPIR